MRRSTTAERIADDDIARNRRIGAHGAAIVPRRRARAHALQHGRARDASATAPRSASSARAVEAGKRVHVWVDETRPVLQGARLTAWELRPTRHRRDARRGRRGRVADGARRGRLVVVGADRIAANGDVANKIGTYALAVLARHHGIPFYVAAPASTIDLGTATAATSRSRSATPTKSRTLGGDPWRPPACAAHNPAFDVTPARLVSGIITEVGIARPPFARSLPSHVRRAAAPAPVRSA